MKISRFRALALVTVAALVLGGCAAPGQGQPGVAAVFHDRVITNANIEALRAGLNDLYSGPNAGEDVTLLLIGPEVVALADQLGLGLTDAQLKSEAELWIAYATQGQVTPTTISPGAIEIVRVVEAINLLMHNADGELALIKLVTDVEANTVASPRYGKFTLKNFTTSIAAISKYIDDNSQGLAGAEYTQWKDVNGFDVTNTVDWISNG